MSLTAHAEFKTSQVPLEHPANGSLLKLKGRPLLLVSGHNQQHRWLSLVDLTTSTAKQLPIAAPLQFFQQARLANMPQSQLVALGQQGIWRFDEAVSQWSLLTPVSSAYPVVDQKRFATLDFAMDLNNDQLTDFIVPDFTGYHVLVQQADGRFSTFTLPINAEMILFGKDPDFNLKPPYTVDMNGDGHTDVVFQRDDTLLVYLQQANGSFATLPKTMALGIGLTPDAEAQQRAGDDRDFSDLTLRTLERLLDLNNDQVPDLVVREQHYASALEQTYSYQIHYGKPAVGMTSAPTSGVTLGMAQYSAKPSQQINTKGVQFDVWFSDLDADGLQDFYMPAAELGIGKIVGALLSGSTSVDWLFYKQQPDGSFGNKPVYQQEVDVAISLRNGQVNLPVTAVLKDKAGRASLLKADGDKVLRQYAPAAGQLFSQKSSRQSLPLPKRAINLLVSDLDDDGDDDLVLPFGQQEAKAESNNQLVILRQ